ncbi:MAG: PHB depolymerase family esterase [Deltaproteobacteria bacterium]|nr:PHB depolymerase family esterase [Deltaproteobacteria bacterium]
MKLVLSRPVRASLLSLIALALAQCSPSPSPTPDVVTATDSGGAGDAGEGLDGGQTADAADTEVATQSDSGRNPLIVARPYRVRAPEGVDRTMPLPLVLLLHGYGASGALQDSYFGMSDQVTARRFLLAMPDGTMDAMSNRFWNASDACCNFGRSAVDDVAYLRAVIDDMGTRYAVDPARIFVVGHSNGGFMGLRLACEMSDRIAGVVSLAGAGFSVASRCTPARAVNILQVHGTADATVLYPGGLFGTARYPGAEQTVGDWAARNGCGMTRVSSGADLDLDTGLPGADTTRTAHEMCRPGGAAELWRINNGGHIPALPPTWSTQVIDWLYAHARS